MAQAGFTVYGTVRSTSVPLPGTIIPLVLDVRDQSSVDQAIAKVRAEAGRIDVLVNNAGASLAGAIEETDLAQAQALFDVNFFGCVRTTQAVLPAMRAQGSGRIVLVSSVVGFLPAPFLGFYAASKHALEGYGESLDHEVRTFGVRVALVEPGFMKTKIDQNTAQAANSLEAYSQMRARVNAAVNHSVENGEDPALVANAIVEASTTRSPKLRYTVGKGTGTLATLRNLLPASMFDRSFRKQFRLDH